MHTTRVACPRCGGEIKLEYRVQPGRKATFLDPAEAADISITGEAGRVLCDCELTDDEWEQIEEAAHIQIMEEAENATG